MVKIVFYYRQHPFPGSRLLGDGLLSLAYRPSSQYGVIAIASIYLVLQQRAVKMKVIYLGPLLASISYKILAQSRSTLLALLVAVIAWQLSAWLLQEEDTRKYRTQLLIVMVFIIAAIAVFLLVYPDFFELAFLRGYVPVRLGVWGQMFARIEDAPWFGHGLNADPRTVISYGSERIWLHPHSVYVGTLLYGGIVGLLLLFAVVISAVWQGFGRARKPINLVSATMFLYGALVIVPNGNMLIHHPKPFWLFFWFPVALVVASELSGHPLYGESETSTDGGTASEAVELS
jgi:O-antigen ligase